MQYNCVCESHDGGSYIDKKFITCTVFNCVIGLCDILSLK